jgi:hypothetical protein
MSHFPDATMPPNRKDESQDVRGNPNLFTAADHNKHDEEIIAIEEYLLPGQPRYAAGFSGVGASGFSSFSGFSGFSGFSAFSGFSSLGEAGDSNLDHLRFVIEALRDLQDNSVHPMSAVVAIRDEALPAADGVIEWPTSWAGWITTLEQNVDDESILEDLATEQPELIDADSLLSLSELEIGDVSDMPEQGYITLINNLAMKRPGIAITGFSSFENTMTGVSVPGTMTVPGSGLIRDETIAGPAPLPDPPFATVLVDLGADFDAAGVLPNSILLVNTGKNTSRRGQITRVEPTRVEIIGELKDVGGGLDYVPTIEPDDTLPIDYAIAVARSGNLAVDSETETINMDDRLGLDFAAAGVLAGMYVRITADGVALGNINKALRIESVSGSSLRLRYDPSVETSTSVIFVIEPPSFGDLDGFSGMYMALGSSGFSGATIPQGVSGPFGFSSTTLPWQTDEDVQEQRAFDKAIRLGTNVEVFYYRGISGNKLLNLTREVKGSTMGYHLQGDLVFKGKLSLWAAPSHWVASSSGAFGIGHIECFVTPTGEVKMGTRETGANDVQDLDTTSNAHAQVQGVLVRKTDTSPRQI